MSKKKIMESSRKPSEARYEGSALLKTKLTASGANCQRPSEIINTSSARGMYDYGSIVRQVEPLSFYGGRNGFRTLFKLFKKKRNSPRESFTSNVHSVFKQSKESLGDRLMLPFLLKGRRLYHV